VGWYTTRRSVWFTDWIDDVGDEKHSGPEQPISMSLLGREFYARDVLTVARELLGQRLVRVLGGERLSGRIVEVEAYDGLDDQASHARSGRTERNASMYGPPGHAYVYFIYGMHYCLNAVAEPEGQPAAVLIRALEPLEGMTTMLERRGGRTRVTLTSGPARLCQALAIDRRFDHADLCTAQSLLTIETDEVVPNSSLETSRRVGVRGDETAVSAPWRFYIRDNPYVS
jgi:DNA-3-methyladenine glycosylase